MKAMVLAAGYGTRLGTLTREVPKPMLLIEGRPMLEYIIVHLRRHGFDHIVVNLHYHPEAIPQYFGDGSAWGINLTYSYEKTLLGTAGGVKNVASFFSNCDEFLIQYGDVVTNEDLSAMLAFHRSRDALATLLVHERENSNSVVCLDEQNRIQSFLERPTEEARRGIQSNWVHSGVAIARRELLDNIPSGRPADLPKDVYVPLVERSLPLFAWPLSGYRCAIDSAERLNEVRNAVRHGRFELSAHVQ